MMHEATIWIAGMLCGVIIGFEIGWGLHDSHENHALKEMKDGDNQR